MPIKRGEEPWHYIADSGEPAFSNSWVNYDASTQEKVAYYKDSTGTVHLKGLMKSGTLAAAFTLPAGYRPTAFAGTVARRFIVNSNNGFGFVSARTDGGIYVDSYSGTGSNAFVDLSGISFRAEA